MSIFGLFQKKIIFMCKKIKICAVTLLIIIILDPIFSPILKAAHAAITVIERNTIKKNVYNRVALASGSNTTYFKYSVLFDSILIWNFFLPERENWVSHMPWKYIVKEYSLFAWEAAIKSLSYVSLLRLQSKPAFLPFGHSECLTISKFNLTYLNPFSICELSCKKYRFNILKL